VNTEINKFPETLNNAHDDGRSYLDFGTTPQELLRIAPRCPIIYSALNADTDWEMEGGGGWRSERLVNPSLVPPSSSLPLHSASPPHSLSLKLPWKLAMNG